MPHEVKDIQITIVRKDGSTLQANASIIQIIEFIKAGQTVVHRNTGITFSLSTAQDILRAKEAVHTPDPPPPLDQRAVIFFKSEPSSFKDGIAKPVIQIALVDKSFLGKVVNVVVKDTNGNTLDTEGIKLIDDQFQRTITFNDQRDRIDGTLQLILPPNPFSKPINFTLLAFKLPPPPPPTKQSNSFEVIFLNNAGFNFSSNVSLNDFERLVQEAKKDIRWRLRGNEVDIPPSFTFEQVIRTIDEILKQIEETNGNGNGNGEAPGGDIFTRIIVGTIGLGLLIGLGRGDKKK